MARPREAVGYRTLICRKADSGQLMSVAVKKGAILAPLAPSGPQAFWNEPFSPPRRCSSERPGAVKGAPLLGAAKRTLDGEDRSRMIAEEGKAGAKGWRIVVPDFGTLTRRL